MKTKVRKRMIRRRGNEMVMVRGVRLPRYGYMDTPQGTWREDRKTGKRVWRRLGNDFPAR